MKALQGQRVTVAGAGALGLTVALGLADAGAEVVVCDPAPLGANASGVAAGMLAPALESVLDPHAAPRLDLLTAARDLWPGLLARLGREAALDRSGALLAETPEGLAGLAAAEKALHALGLAPRRWTGRALREAQPGLSEAVAEGLYVAEDWRLAPGLVLAALAAALAEAGGRILASPLRTVAGDFVVDGEAVRGHVVIAVGAEAGLSELVPELVHLAPVKGQILRFAAGPEAGPVVRSLHGYVSPQAGGALAGASMELGRRDLDPDPVVVARLRAEAARLFPHLAEAPAEARSGIRATTPDGLPLVGRSAGGRAILAAGARRNGWLLAPLVARAVTGCLAGAAPDPAFDPARFRKLGVP